MSIKISKAKEIRENLNLTHLVILGITEDGQQHVATHGKSVLHAKQAAKLGNDLKKNIGWPDELCSSKPLERICGNCSYWKMGYHRPGDVIKENFDGKCMIEPSSVSRFEKDIACRSFEPKL